MIPNDIPPCTMDNTAPDRKAREIPNELTVFPPSGEPFAETEAQFQSRMAENSDKSQTLIQEVDSYWQWLVAAEPNKLSPELAAQDLFSVIVNHLVVEGKVAGTDIVSAVKRSVEEHRQ